MYTASNYVLVQSLDQALELNRKRSSAIIGGGCWLRLGRKKIGTLIDLSALGLDKIQENEEEISLGAMVTLRQMETSRELEAAFGPFFADMVRHIVGVQFRNCATLGGSVAARFGFSDILTGLMALDCQVELAQKGRMPLEEYARLAPDRDILTAVVVKKDGRKAVYQSARNISTDLPVLTCALSHKGDLWRLVFGARPGKAEAVETGDPGSLEKLAGEFSFGGNMRGSEEYRRHLAGVLTRRALEQLRREEE